ncbi:MAG: UTP--glucose-1-phosphate uridylyltransferase [Candidatus Latescibacteria bacterium]|jgi:UTP--glucose-1-phosphate uridylyltransferase|nr:UTP--glucose-1-phosphate uridylyltransferase [Candidatus Latescibacterota bacterium]
MSITKAVIPVAGLGTRLLPATKSQPKEMLPIGRKPIVQYVVEELAEAGLDNILFVTGQKKRSIEDHFDFSPELGDKVIERDFPEHLSFFYIRQTNPNGLGDAISYAKKFTDDNSFTVALGDSVIMGGDHSSLLKRMVEIHENEKAGATVAFMEVTEEDVRKYGIAKPKGRVGASFEVEELIEKPHPSEAPSRLAIAARYVFDPAIFEAIKRTPAGRKGELEITDSMNTLLKMGKKIIGVKLRADEHRYDVGGFETYFKAFIDFALDDPEYGYMIRQYMRKKLKEV